MGVFGDVLSVVREAVTGPGPDPAVEGSAASTPDPQPKTKPKHSNCYPPTADRTRDRCQRIYGTRDA